MLKHTVPITSLDVVLPVKDWVFATLSGSLDGRPITISLIQGNEGGSTLAFDGQRLLAQFLTGAADAYRERLLKAGPDWTVTADFETDAPPPTTVSSVLVKNFGFRLCWSRDAQLGA